MRKINGTSRFKRDLKREQRGLHRSVIERELPAIITALANDEVLPAKLRDHALTGDLADHRDCHLRPDLVLIYTKQHTDELTLVRIGSHSELEL